MYLKLIDKMKNIITIALIIIAIGCTTTPVYHIQGTIESDFEGKVFLKKQVGYAYETIDSAIVENKTFEFDGVVEFPDIYGMSFDGQKATQKICLENVDYQIEIGETIKDSKISGGEYQALMTDFTEEMGLLDTGERKLINLIWRDTTVTKEEKDSLYVVLKELRENKMSLANSYIENNAGSPHAPVVLNIYIRNFLTVDQLDSVHQTFTEEVKRSNTGSQIGKSIIGIRQSAIGQPMIDFSLPGVDGEIIKLSDVVKDNKLVFIDFWASWCGPCRASIPELKRIYEKYHSKGLEFLAVSYDDDREKWIKAIEDEGFTWINASNLVGWNCSTAQQYAVRGIPASVLITKDGIIAARSLRGQALEDKIVELLEISES